MPEKEELASETLQKAREGLKGLNVELVIDRARSLAAFVERAATKIDERTAIVALPAVDDQLGEPAKTAEDLLGKLSTEVILVRSPLDDKR
jgi:hypothetical protein